jgi:putative acyl-CoA dehydrogenase
MLEAAMATHEVFNQSGSLDGLDLFSSDRALVEALGAACGDGTRGATQATGAAGAAGAAGARSSHDAGDARRAVFHSLESLGRRLGAAETLELGRLANSFPPQLRLFDRFGHRIDEVEFHPAWHALMTLLVREGIHASPWSGPGADSAVVRTAKYLLFSQVENGSQCPVTMTWAAIPLIAAQPALAQDWLQKLLSREYDPVPGPLTGRQGALIGMGMTEKQGGSDVRSNTTRAEPVPVSDFGDRWGAPHRLTGHKWFMSAPMCDAFLMLAQAPEGLSCFFVPRWLPDGARNPLLLQRLKDKLGNRSNASSEVEFDGTAAFLVGEPGRGIATILEMGALTRLDCAIASAGIMRRAVAEATHHAANRAAFGKPLAQQPLMRNVLADLALESEAAVRWVLRLARALDERETNQAAAALLRIGTPLAKYWICRRGPALAFEAMEVLGGNGYVEEGPLARLYRELPVNSIWEGSGNVMCLDVLRALGREPACRDALAAELQAALGRDPRYDRFVAPLLEGVLDQGRSAGSAGPSSASVTASDSDPSQARRLAGHLSRAWQAALMLADAPPEVADAFCAGRLDDSRAAGDQAFGTLPAGIELAAIVARAMPSKGSS